MTDLVKEAFLQVLTSSFKVSIIVALLLILTKLIEERYSAGFRYYSWLAIIVIFLIPFHSIGLSYNVDIPHSTLHIQSEYKEKHEKNTSEVFDDTFEEMNYEKEKTEFFSEIHSEGKNEKANIKQIDILFSVALVWMLGVVLCFVLHLKRYCFFKNAVKRFSLPTCDIRIERILQEEQKYLKITKALPVRVCCVVDTPLLTGLFREMIILPDNNYSDDELHLILRHELIHYKRKDIWYQFLTLIFVSLHWFNPFVYIMARSIEIDGETSCDETVLKRNSYETRIFYGEMLIAFLKTKNQKKSYLTTTFFGGKKAMKKRLMLIASKKTRKNGIAAMAILLIATIMMSITVSAGNIAFVDSKDMVKNSSKRENTIIMDLGEAYDVFIGCDPIREDDESIKVPLKSFMVFIDYKTVSEEPGKSITISNGNRNIELTVGSNTVRLNGVAKSLEREVLSRDNDFYLYIDDIEILFSYKVSYDFERNNVILTVTDETPKAVKTNTPSKPLPENYVVPPKVTVLQQGAQLAVFVDETSISFPDAQPFIDEENRTQVPVRALAEMLNCRVIWNQQTQGVTIIGDDGTVVTAKIGDDKIIADGTIIQMDTVARIIDNRTYLPLRFVSEALGFNVFWKY